MVDTTRSRNKFGFTTSRKGAYHRTLPNLQPAGAQVRSEDPAGVEAHGWHVQRNGLNSQMREAFVGDICRQFVFQNMENLNDVFPKSVSQIYRFDFWHVFSWVIIISQKLSTIECVCVSSSTFISRTIKPSWHHSPFNHPSFILQTEQSLLRRERSIWTTVPTNYRSYCSC